jgi:hypothetical protein
MTVATDGQGNTVQLNAWLNSKGGAAATDACGNIVWTNNFTAVNPTCGSAGYATVTFTATDACGNASTTAATFTITDNVNPSLIQQASDLTIAAGPNSEVQLQSWLASHGGAQAVDLGGDITWQNNFGDLSDGCGNTGSATVTFTASDPCGNSVNTTALVQVTDQTPPTIETAAAYNSAYCGDQNVQTLLQQWLNNHGGATATDAGGPVTWQHNFSALSDGCGTSGSATVMFTATDPCGNSASTTAIFQVTDQVAPVLETIARDTTVYCHNNDVPALMQQWLLRNGGARATDPCGAVTWTHNFSDPIDTCQANLSYTVTFTARDECLNNQPTTATFTIADTIATAVQSPDDIKVQLYPNPADDVLNVVLDHGADTPITITLGDAFGRIVYRTSVVSGQTRIPVDQFPAGVYIVCCETEKQRGTKVVLVQ